MKNETYGHTIERIWIISREYDGLAGAGGVKDVCRQLAEVLAAKAQQVCVVLPLYGFINAEAAGFNPICSFQVDINYVGVERREQVRIWEQVVKGHDNLSIYLVEADRYQEKKAVYTYTASEEADNAAHVSGSGHYDYFAMNVLLQKAALDLMLYQGIRPEIIHCHDGHAAILPAMAREIEGYRHFFRETGLVVTVHNAGLGYHQEVADLPFAKAITGLPSRLIGKNLLNGSFDPFLAAAPYVVMNTVSENYARELRETADDELTGWLGHHLARRGVMLKGVTNGINPDDFNPEEPEKLGIAAPFSPGKGDLAGKRLCRSELIHRLNRHEQAKVRISGSLHDNPELPLFTLIGRLTEQKGVDMLVSALQTLLLADQGFQILILGTGAKEIENDLISLAEMPENRGRVCIALGYDQKLANQIYAAGDFFLIPSRYEPCGLTDYIAQLFGNLPIVHYVGGLVKVQDGRTGFAYREHSAAALLETIRKALVTFRQHREQISEMQRESIKVIHKSYTWDKIVLRYLELYQEALALCSRQ